MNQRFPKHEAFQKRLEEEYSPNRPAYLDRIAWWDEGALTLSTLTSKVNQMGSVEKNENNDIEQCKPTEKSDLELKELQGKWKQEKELTQKLQRELEQLREENLKKQHQIEYLTQRTRITLLGSVVLIIVMGFFLIKWRVNNNNNNNNKKDHPL
jgi:hypothetical protein